MEHLIKSQKNKPRITRMNTNFRSKQMQTGFFIRVNSCNSWPKVFASGYAGLGLTQGSTALRVVMPQQKATLRVRVIMVSQTDHIVRRNPKTTGIDFRRLN